MTHGLQKRFSHVIHQLQKRIERTPATESEDVIVKTVEAAARAEAKSSLTAKELRVSALSDRIVELMEAKGISLDDLVTGLEEEREAIWREQQRSGIKCP